MEKQVDDLLSRKPCLKAKEIARELGLTRKDVNSFLYRHKGKYSRDSAYRWRLNNTDKCTVILPEGWVTSSAFEDRLKESAPLFADAEPPREYRRLVCLSQATIADSSSC